MTHTPIIKFALLGSIPKGDEIRKDWDDWKNEYIKTIKSALPEASFLNGDLISDNLGSELVVGHDLWMIKNSDFIIVNAENKIGAGTAQEMVIAKKFNQPVISIIPKNSHHRKSNIKFDGAELKEWIHPFLFISSDYVANDIQDAVRWVKNYLKLGKSEAKNLGVFDKAIRNFEIQAKDMVNEYKKQGW